MATSASDTVVPTSVASSIPEVTTTSTTAATSTTDTETTTSVDPTTSTSTSTSTSDTSTSTSTSTSSSTPSPTSSSTTSSSTSASSSSSSTSSSTSTSSPTSTSTSSSTPSSTSSSTSTSSRSAALTTSLSTSRIISTDAAGNTVTRTTVVTNTASVSSVNASSTASASSRTFFENKGAVAGVFTVVGIIVVAIVIAILTVALRRRRAKKFDRDVAEAAREAAAAHPPIFADDDLDGDHNYGNSGNYGEYSDVSSHGTYAQPPMGHIGGGGQEAYGMSELQHPSYDPYLAGVGAGAAGVGAAGALARARSQREMGGDGMGMAGYGAGGFNPGYGETQSPYPAFAGPPRGDMYNVPPPVPTPYSGAGGYGPGRPEYDLLDAAGMGGVAAAPMSRGASQSQSNSSQSNYDLSRNQSQAGRSLLDGAYSGGTTAPADYNSPQSAESYASHYQPGFRVDNNAPIGNAYAPDMPVPQDGADNDAAYGGYSSSSHGHGDGLSPAGSMPNPYSATSAPEGQGYHEESDEEDEGDHRRVLKVANE